MCVCVSRGDYKFASQFVSGIARVLACLYMSVVNSSPRLRQSAAFTPNKALSLQGCAVVLRWRGLAQLTQQDFLDAGAAQRKHRVLIEKEEERLS